MKNLYKSCLLTLVTETLVSDLFRSDLSLNKPAAGQALPDATPPVGKIHPFSKVAVTVEPIQRF